MARCARYPELFSSPESESPFAAAPSRKLPPEDGDTVHFQPAGVPHDQTTSPAPPARTQSQKEWTVSFRHPGTAAGSPVLLHPELAACVVRRDGIGCSLLNFVVTVEHVYYNGADDADITNGVQMQWEGEGADLSVFLHEFNTPYKP